MLFNHSLTRRTASQAVFAPPRPASATSRCPLVRAQSRPSSEVSVPLHAVLLPATQWHGFAGAQGVTLSPDFYNREDESQLLRQWVLSTSAQIMVLMGPRSCGKTALMKHVLLGLQEEGSIGLSYIDTRQVVWWVLMPYRRAGTMLGTSVGGLGSDCAAISHCQREPSSTGCSVAKGQEALSVRQTRAASPYAAGGAIASFS